MALYAALETQVGGGDNFNIHLLVLVYLKKPNNIIGNMEDSITHGLDKGASRMNTLSCIGCLPSRVMLTVIRNNMQLISE